MTADSAKATGELIKRRILMGLFRIVLGSARYGQTTSINAVVDLVAFDTVSPRTSSGSLARPLRKELRETYARDTKPRWFGPASVWRRVTKWLRL